MIDDMTPREMYKMMKDAKADIMLSGGKSQFVALKAGMPWLDINQERSHAYMGYVGMVEAGPGNRQGALQSDMAAAPPARAVGEWCEELAGQGDRANGCRGGCARRRSRGGGKGAPCQEDLQLQDGRPRHYRGCDPGAWLDDGRRRSGNTPMRPADADFALSGSRISWSHWRQWQGRRPLSCRPRSRAASWRSSPSGKRHARSIR